MTFYLTQTNKQTNKQTNTNKSKTGLYNTYHALLSEEWILITPYLEYILKLVQNIKTTLRASLNIHNAVAASYQAGWINCVSQNV